MERESPNWLSEFSARESELSQLMAAYRACAKDNRPRVVVLEGESGSGKSRLLWEFYRQLRRTHDPHGYWPASLPGDLLNICLEPCWSDAEPWSKEAVENGAPFIWWPWHFPDVPNDAQLSRATLAMRGQLDWIQFHTLLQDRKNTLTQGASPKVDRIAASAMPLMREVVGMALVANPMSIYEAFKKAAERARHFKVVEDFARNQSEALREQRQHLNDELLARLKNYFDPGLGMAGSGLRPLIIAVDNLQGVDAEAGEFLCSLLNAATKEAWPMLFVATIWPEQRATARLALSGASALNDILSALELIPEACRSLVSLGGSAPSVSLLRRAFPGLEKADLEAMAESCGGDLHALNLLIEEFRNSPKRFASRDVSRELSESGRRQIGQLKSPRKSLLERRFRALKSEVKDLLACASLQGAQFLDEIACEVADTLVVNASSPDQDARQLLEYSRSPLFFIENATAYSSIFKAKPYHEVAFDYASEAAEELELMARTSVQVLERRISTTRLNELDFGQLEELLNFASDVLPRIRTLAGEVSRAGSLDELMADMLGMLAVIKTTRIRSVVKPFEHRLLLESTLDRFPKRLCGEWLLTFRNLDWELIGDRSLPLDQLLRHSRWFVFAAVESLFQQPTGANADLALSGLVAWARAWDHLEDRAERAETSERLFAEDLSAPFQPGERIKLIELLASAEAEAAQLCALLDRGRDHWTLLVSLELRAWLGRSTWVRRIERETHKLACFEKLSRVGVDALNSEDWLKLAFDGELMIFLNDSAFRRDERARALLAHIESGLRVGAPEACNPYSLALACKVTQIRLESDDDIDFVQHCERLKIFAHALISQGGANLLQSWIGLDVLSEGPLLGRPLVPIGHLGKYDPAWLENAWCAISDAARNFADLRRSTSVSIREQLVKMLIRPIAGIYVTGGLSELGIDDSQSAFVSRVAEAAHDLIDSPGSVADFVWFNALRGYAERLSPRSEARIAAGKQILSAFARVRSRHLPRSRYLELEKLWEIEDSSSGRLTPGDGVMPWILDATRDAIHTALRSSDLEIEHRAEVCCVLIRKWRSELLSTMSDLKRIEHRDALKRTCTSLDDSLDAIEHLCASNVGNSKELIEVVERRFGEFCDQLLSLD